MSLKPWKRRSTEIVSKNAWWEYRRDACELPNGKEGEYHYVHVEGSVVVIPVLDDGRVLLTRQWRFLAEQPSMEFPSGGIEGGEDAFAAAHRELEEETGYASDSLSFVTTFYPCNGYSDEVAHIFVARALRGGAPSPDESEVFEYASLLPRDVDAKIYAGDISDGISMLAWLLAKPMLEGRLSPRALEHYS